jgi:hypothetical protein
MRRRRGPQVWTPLLQEATRDQLVRGIANDRFDAGRLRCSVEVNRANSHLCTGKPADDAGAESPASAGDDRDLR